jgi:acyl-CoA synthetase (NDP forming)
MIGPHAFPYADFHYGVSKICDLGNKCDVDESDMLEYLENDPSTKVIAMHTENVRDANRFFEIARRVTYQKPVLLLKSARTNEVGIMSTSQTGSLSLGNQIFDGICKQVGIIRLEKFGELFEIPKFFAYQPLPKANKLGIVSHTGMGAALATDEGAKYNLSIAKLSPETAAKLNLIFPNLWKTFIDIGPLASSRSDYLFIYPEILKTILADDNIDSLLHILWANPGIGSVEDYINIYRELNGSCQKPIAIWIYGPRLTTIYDIAYNLEDLGFPVFLDLETAIKAIGVAYQYATWKSEKHKKETMHYS